MAKKPFERLIYTDCRIPAVLFFDELMNGNISVLGKASPELLIKTYMDIVDEFCDLDNNEKLRSWFEKQNKISKIQRAIYDVTTCLNPIKILCYNQNHLEAFVEVINKIEYPNVNFDINKPLNEEIKRVETQVIGILQNRLNMELPEQENVKREIKKDFNDRLVSVENALNRSIDENVSLRKFIALEKSAIQASKRVK